MKNDRSGQALGNDPAAGASVSWLSRVAVVILFVGLIHEASAQNIDFDIVAQPTDDTLLELAETAGIQIAFAAERASQSTSPSITGPHSVEEALDEALQGTGLDYQFANAEFVVVTEGGNLSVPATEVDVPRAGQTNQLAQLRSAPSQAQTASSQSNDAAMSVVTGKVTDLRTGANLSGARVSIEETGQWTSTDDLGEFRFVSVPKGTLTLTVSYLGYASQSAVLTVRGEGVSQSFGLRGGSEVEEIVVFGQRSARAMALNQERTAANVSTVVSSDLLGNFTGTTISEALRRMPGVAFQQDPLTGAGTNIIVRGLEPDFNTVKLNGMELPVGDGQGRSADLSNLLADSVESITIHKSLLPSHDSGGTGGLIEIETKSPLDRARRFVNFLVEGAERGSDFSDDLLVSGTLSGSFGDDDTLGLSASVQYRDRSNTNIGFGAMSHFGQHLPLDSVGSTTIRSFFNIDPATPFPWEDSADDAYVFQSSSGVNDVSTETLAVTLSSEWQAADHTNLRLDYQRSVSDSRATRRTFGFTDRSRYSEQPVQSLGGELRQALAWGGTGRVGLVYNRIDTEADADVLTFRGVTDVGPWQTGYNAGYTIGERRTPNLLSVGMGTTNVTLVPYTLPEAVDPIEGRIITLFGRRRGDGVQMPLLTQAGSDLFRDPANYRLGRPTHNTGLAGKNERYTASFDLRRSFDHPTIRYLKAGIAYEGSRFKALGFRVSRQVLGSLDPVSLGLALDENDLSSVGLDSGFLTPSRASAERFLSEIFTQAETDPSLTLRERFPDPLSLRSSTDEDEFAAYLETQLDFGEWELIGGVRATRVEVTAVNRTGPTFIDADGNFDRVFAEEFARLITQAATQTDVLPRLLVNYRPTENLVFRGSYHLTVARPRISQLSAEQRVELNLFPNRGPNRNQPELRVRQGNPDLNPSSTDNYDLSVEYYDDRIGVVKLGAFYKRIDDFIQGNTTVESTRLDGVELPDDPRFQPENLPADLFISRSQPENSQDPADIWGVEVAIERQLTFLPGVWNGLGVFANYTYSDSSKTVFFNWSRPQFDTDENFVGYVDQVATFDDVAFDQQPKESGTVALTYNKYGLDATVAYSYQGWRAENGSGFGQRFDEAADSLDFRVEYRFGLGDGDFRVYFEGANVLDGSDDPAVLAGRRAVGGTPAVIEEGTYLGGREFRLGFASTF